MQNKNKTECILDPLNELADTFDNKGISVVETKEEHVENTNAELELIIENNEGIWNCRVCGKMSDRKDHIKIHAETHKEGVVHSCQICNKISPTRSSLVVHISSFHSGLSLTCDICSKSWVSRNAFNKHNRVHHITDKAL